MAFIQWNDFERQTAVLKVIRANTTAFECKRACEHTIFDVQTVQLEDKFAKLIVVQSVDPENNCHACAPELSYFLYEVDHEGQKLVYRSIAHHTFGSWGFYSQDWLSLKRISKGNVGIFHHFYMLGKVMLSKVQQCWLL